MLVPRPLLSPQKPDSSQCDDIRPFISSDTDDTLSSEPVKKKVKGSSGFGNFSSW